MTSYFKFVETLYQKNKWMNTESFTCSLGWCGDRRRVYSRHGNLGLHRRIPERSVHTDHPLCCLDSSTHTNTNKHIHIKLMLYLQRHYIDFHSFSNPTVSLTLMCSQHEVLVCVVGIKCRIWLWEHNAGSCDTITKKKNSCCLSRKLFIF